MQDPPHRQSYRGIQRSPRPGTAAYMQGKKQATLSMQRYHILCAALQNKYEVKDAEPILPVASSKFIDFLTIVAPYHLHPGPDIVHVRPRINVTICFSAYEEFTLPPIKDVKILDPTDESVNNSYIEELGMYEATIRDDWRIREGGWLRALAEYGDFFDCIADYHSCQKKSRIKYWDWLFVQLQNSEFRKNIVPCMVSPILISLPMS
jgi:hypothetical protein